MAEFEIKNAAKFDSKLSVGDYYFGDPCYIFGAHNSNLLTDAMWSAVVHGGSGDLTIFDVSKDGKYVGSIRMASTAFGDGSYGFNPAGKRNHYVPVDAGLLAIIDKGVFDAIGADDSSYAPFSVSEPTGFTVLSGNWYFNGIKVCDTGGDEDDMDDGEYEDQSCWDCGYEDGMHSASCSENICSECSAQSGQHAESCSENVCIECGDVAGSHHDSCSVSEP
jgi:hypothetical protein